MLSPSNTLSRRRVPPENGFTPAALPPARTPRRRRAGFALVEVLTGAAVAIIGFLGAYATVIHAGKLVTSAEEDALAFSGLERRVDQLRTLEWNELTDGTGLRNKVWNARPESVASFPGLSETMTISAYNVNNAKILQGSWVGSSNPSVTFTAATQNLSVATAVKVVATLSWTGRRSNRTQQRSIVTVISKGGLSKSDL